MGRFILLEPLQIIELYSHEDEQVKESIKTYLLYLRGRDCGRSENSEGVIHAANNCLKGFIESFYKDGKSMGELKFKYNLN